MGRFRLSVTTDPRSEFADGNGDGGDVTANWTVLEPESVSVSAGSTFQVLEDHSILVPGVGGAVEDYTVTAVTSLVGITGFRLEALADGRLPGNGPGRAYNGNFVLSEFTVDAAPAAAPQPKPVVVDSGLHATAFIGYGNPLVRTDLGKLYVAYGKAGGFCHVKWSTDNGATWSDAVRTEAFDNASAPITLALDPNGVIYQGLQFNVGAFFNKSTDGGATWSAPVALGDGGWGAWDYLPMLVCEAPNLLHGVYYSAFGWNDPPFNLFHRSSVDGGNNWTEAVNLTQIPHDSSHGKGATQASLAQDQQGRLFIAYNLEVNGHSEATLLVKAGAEWLPPKQVSEPGKETSGAPVLAVDSNGLVRLAWIERDMITHNGRVCTRTYEHNTATLGPIATLTSPDDNASSVTLGAYAEEQVYIAYDTYNEATKKFGSVYLLSSHNGFVAPLKLSERPGAYYPALRRDSHLNCPAHPDIIWHEPAAGGALQLLFVALPLHPTWEVAVPPVITSSLTAEGSVDNPFGYQITASNNPTQFGAEGLPTGLSVEPNSGAISGTPTATGLFPVTIWAQNAGGRGEAVLLLTVDERFFYRGNESLVMNGPIAPTTFTTTRAYFVTRAGTYHWNNGAGQAAGTIGLRSQGGTLYGPWPATLRNGVYWSVRPNLELPAGTYTVEDSDPGTWAWNEESGGAGMAWGQGYAMPLPAAPVITSPLTADGSLNGPFSYQITASNNPTQFGAEGLPTGLSVEPNSGAISGTPTVTGLFPVTIWAQNAGGRGEAVLLLTVDEQFFYIGNASLVMNGPTAPTVFTITRGYLVTLVETYHWNYGAGQAAGTIGLRSQGGTLYGPWPATLQNGVYWWVTPNLELPPGTYTVEDSDPATWSWNLESGGAGMAWAHGYPLPLAPAPVITSSLTAEGSVDNPFGYQITASNNPTQFGAEGLPTGLSVEPNSGAISGTPTATGLFPVTIWAQNAGGRGEAVLLLTVDEQFFYIGNASLVMNGPTAPTVFTITRGYLVTLVETYHWNYGAGQAPGTIGLRSQGGTLYGPWPATLRNGVYWSVRPNLELPAGTYTVEDSDPGTWAWNEESGGAGMAWGQGYAMPLPPSLTITRPLTPEGEIVISWPASATGFILEAAVGLEAPDWQPVGQTPMLEGDQLVVSISATGRKCFYRLARQ